MKRESHVDTTHCDHNVISRNGAGILLVIVDVVVDLIDRFENGARVAENLGYVLLRPQVHARARGCFVAQT